jgi:hypothetical protein
MPFLCLSRAEDSILERDHEDEAIERALAGDAFTEEQKVAYLVRWIELNNVSPALFREAWLKAFPGTEPPSALDE